MKKAILFHLMILLFACNQAGENSTESGASKETELESRTDKTPVNEEEIVSDIRKKFGEINQNTDSYETKSMELSGGSSEGGELKSYYQNEELKKVVASYYGEMGKLIEEYYFSGNNLFFVFTKEYSYDKPITVKDSKVIKTDENRYYFHNDKLVRWLDPNNEKVASSDFNQKESELLQKVKDLKGKLGSPETGQHAAPESSDDYPAMKSLFGLSPLSIFDETTEGLSSSEKNDLLKKGESGCWKITEVTKTKMALLCEENSSEVIFHFLKNKDNPDGLLFAEIANGQYFNIHSWKYSHKGKTLQKADVLKKYSANDFVSKEDKLPDSYEPLFYYNFIDDQTIEVSVHTWMEPEFKNREIINKIFLKWNGKNFEEKNEKIKS